MVYGFLLGVGIWVVFAGFFFGSAPVLGVGIVWIVAWVGWGLYRPGGGSDSQPYLFEVPPYHERIAPDRPRRQR